MMRWGAACVLAASAASFGGTYVVPTQNASVPGNQSLGLGSAPQRIQEIVGSGQFTAPLVITGLRFRAAPNTGPINFTYPSLKITVSTTQTYPNTNNGHTLPSTTYANNTGPDAVTVYNAALTGTSAGCMGGAPCPFDISIPFTSPFSFDPTKGRLLVDMVNSAPTGTPMGSLDVISFSDSSSSTAALVNGDPTQATGKLNLAGIILGLDTTTGLITAVENAASSLAPGLPNAGIAQGAIFIVQGSSLGPSTLTFAPAAFQTNTVSGTSVSVMVNGTTVNAPLYYTSAGQVAALLPSNTPTGAGTVTVTYNGAPSTTGSITVVPNNVGIFTIDSSGQGPGIVTYADYSLVSAAKAANCGGPNTTCGAANPGDTLILWATGLGPVSGNDASGAGLGQNMPIIPLTVWLGGVQASVSYQGRSGCCVGLDQIVFTVPAANAPTGCAVPLAVQIGNQVSNTTAIPIASGSRNCTTTIPQYAGAEAAVLAGPITTGSIKLAHFSDGGGTFEDDAKFQFQEISSFNPGTQPFAISWIDAAPPGTCTVYNNLNANENPPIASLSKVDAGSSFSIQGPNGSVNVPPGSLNQFNSKGTFLVPGAYMVAGAGGAVIGPFSANITLPPPITLVSPVNNAVASRSSGLQVNWTGGVGNEYVQIAVNGPIDGTYTTGSSVACIVPGTAGTFTIPSYVLLALPPTANGASAGLVLSAITLNSFTASGLSLGLLQTYTDMGGFGYGWGSGSFNLQ